MTYSLVARDPTTGELGVALQSHFFGVGPVVAWAEPGIGVVATQALVEPAYGPRGLAALRDGRPAPAALAELVAADDGAAVRQVAIADPAGRVGVHTGERAIAHAGHATGDGVSVQANMMRDPGVPEAMLAAWETGAAEPLAERMLACLDAAEAAGGDVRGRQSAALVVVAGEASGDLFADRPVDIRVDDHPEPLDELRRLLTVRRAYQHQERGEDLAEAGDFDAALAEFDTAARLAPGNTEIAFWRGVALVSLGRADEARPHLERAAAEHDGWRALYERLPAAGLLPGAAPPMP